MNSLSHPVSLIGKSMQKLAGLPVPALLAIAIGWIVLEFVWLGKFSLMIVGDNISIIPYYMAMVAGDMTVDNWMPYPAAGTDFSATGYSAIILRLVFSILPSWAAFQVLAIAPVVAGVLGVYGLCRRNFNLDIAASIFAGFAYGVLFFREIFFLSAVPGYLPLTVLALSHLLDNKSDVRWWLGLAGAGFLIAETSFITRLVPWPVATYAVWFLIVERRRRFSDWAIIILFSAAIMAARWQDITALLAYAPLSVLHEIRSSADLATVMAHFIQSLSGLVSYKHFISGGLLLLFGGALLVERTAGGIRVLFSLAAVIVLFLLASLTKVAAALLWPFLSSFNVAYILQGFHLFAVIAGGIGFQFVTRLPGRAQHPERPLIRAAAFLPAALFATLVAVNVEMKVNHIKAWLSWGNMHQNSQSPDMLKLAADIRARNSPVRALSFQMHGNLLNSYGIETIAGYHPMVLRRYHEYWSKMAEPWFEMEDWKSEFGEMEMGAVLSILPFAGTSRAKVQSQWELGKFVRINMLSLANGGYVVSRDVLTDDRLIKVSGPRRSWNSLSQEEKTLNHLKANFTGKRHHYLYRNPDVLPRAFTVNRARVFESGSAVLNALSRADTSVLAKTVFFEAGHHPQSQLIEGPLRKTDVEISVYQSDRIEVEIAESREPTVLVVTNSYSPYWIGLIDGVETPVFPADHAFWGVFVPAGAKKVVFEYRPPYRLR